MEPCVEHRSRGDTHTYGQFRVNSYTNLILYKFGLKTGDPPPTVCVYIFTSVIVYTSRAGSDNLA